MSLTKSLFATLATVLGAEATFAANDAVTKFGLDKAKGANLDGGNGLAWDRIGAVVQQLLTLISIIAVAYVLWAGFQIMTAGGDEEKVKTGRKTIVYVFVGIVVMWLAYWIVSLVIGNLG